MQIRVCLITCILVCLLSPVKATADSFSAGSAGEGGSEKQEPRERCVMVREWFSKYDQIRRDAEMTTGDKLQSLLLAAKKPEEENAALATRMLEKYTTAISGMKELESLPETRELHEGYIEYFSMARQLFADYLDAQKAIPFTNQSLIPTKKKLEVLEKTNRQLDRELRKKYTIVRHRHS